MCHRSRSCSTWVVIEGDEPKARGPVAFAIEAGGQTNPARSIYKRSVNCSGHLAFLLSQDLLSSPSACSEDMRWNRPVTPSPPSSNSHWYMPLPGPVIA